MLAVKVKDGTGAGSRTVRERPPWIHACAALPATFRSGRVLPGTCYSCADCGARRPT